MKRWILVGLLLLSGCDEDGRIRGVEPPVVKPWNSPVEQSISESQYHYQDRVVVTQGFYQGSHGTVNRFDLNYEVRLDDGLCVWVGGEWLRKE